MLSFDEALSRVLATAAPLGTERVALDDAQGRVLRETLRAETPLPPHDYSAMDGYAVRTSSMMDGPGPFDIPVRGESRTGRVAEPLSPGSACRIFTGAPLPEGADAIVMQEDVVRDGDRAMFARRPSPGEHVRRAGEDLPGGALALEAGTRLEAYQLGLVAALDRGDVVVSRQPRVTVLCTGDELRAPGSARRPGTIPESNGVAIGALARQAGAIVSRSGPVPDDAEAARARFAQALDESDVVVTVGGVSVGDYDVVRPALEAAGVHLDFYEVAIKPGKPLTLGRRGRTVVLGLPGNPVSAQVTFALFGLPLLRALAGDRRVVPAAQSFRLGAPIVTKPGRRGFHAATISGGTAIPLASRSSGSTTSLAHADALVIVPEDSSGLEAGAEVRALLLSDL